MTTLYENFLSGTTTDNPLSDSATTINSSNFANLPTVTAPDILWITLDADASAGAPEIVKVTTHTAAATSVTVTRGEQGTVARSHVSGTDWEHAPTKSDADAWAAFLEDGAVDTDNLASAAVTAAKVASEAYTDWAPALTATTTSPTGHTLDGRYEQVGRRVYGWFEITFNAGGTDGEGDYEVAVPVACETTGAAGRQLGVGLVRDTTNPANMYPVVWTREGKFKIHTVAQDTSGTWDHTGTTPTNLEYLSVQFDYEAAS